MLSCVPSPLAMISCSCLFHLPKFAANPSSTRSEFSPPSGQIGHPVLNNCFLSRAYVASLAGQDSDSRQRRRTTTNTNLNQRL
eukprot:5027547-Heterocapsa_arctica.AAC.1